MVFRPVWSEMGYKICLITLNISEAGGNMSGLKLGYRFFKFDQQQQTTTKFLFANLKCSDISRVIPQKAELIEAGS